MKIQNSKNVKKNLFGILAVKLFLSSLQLQAFSLGYENPRLRSLDQNFKNGRFEIVFVRIMSNGGPYL